ncbi:MAG TPA: CpcT/CpeT family chromophore lyase [Thermoanaerobaculia bacterium]|nr:CpcT/CpeT family chromophore lyase [Thermoanaerobaculia bacterium]
MRLRAALAAALILPAAAPAAGLPPSVAEVAGLLPGSYVSRDSGASVRFAVAAVPKSRIAADSTVFYVEAARVARPDAPFLQRFLVLDADGSRVALRVYEPRDLAGVRGKWREPEALTLFTARDVRERPDCRMTLSKTPAGDWAGGTAGETCFSAAADARLKVSISLSPQTLEWREEGTGAAGKTVLGPAGEITVYARERETPIAPGVVAAPVAGGTAGGGGFSSKVNGGAADAPAVLAITAPSSPSKKYDLAELRAMAGEGQVPLSRLVPSAESPSASVVVVTSRGGSLSVFSFAEISSSSSLSISPSLDVSGGALRLVAPPGRSLDDVVAIELRALAPAK